MFLRNKYFVYVILFFCIFFANSYSICLDYPSYVKVYSGADNVGTFDYNYLNSGQLVFIKGDLDNYPLKVDFYFENIEEDCFSSSDDVMMRLFSSGLLFSADSISKSSNSTIASFTFDVPVIAPNTFNSNYLIKTKNNPTGTEDIIRFGVDDENPFFTTFSMSPAENLIKPNTTIRFDYTISEPKSGLELFRITGGNQNVIVNFQGEKFYSNTLEETITSSKKYVFYVKDKLGNTNQINYSYIVDSDAPVLSDLSVDSYTKNEIGTRKVSFSIDIEDISFEYDDSPVEIFGDFTSLNDIDSKKQGNCIKDNSIDTKYHCVFSEIGITKLTDTTLVNIIISAQDKLENKINTTYSKEIFYDTKGPVILDFYLENGMGERNIFNSLDTNSKVYLKFTDQSANQRSDIRVIANFDGIEYYLIPNCNNVSNQKGVCFWELGNTLGKYSGVSIGNVEFKVTLVDIYGNPTTKSINLTINNERPLITKIELIETTDIKDYIVNSKEKINFRLFIKDSNLKFDKDFIYANFSAINYEEGSDKKGGNCNYYNESLIQCDFIGIVLENGYMKKNVTFTVTDTAANSAVMNYPVEIFAIGDEVFSSFKIPTIPIINVLDRNVVKNSGIDAWFEGAIENYGVSDGIVIVNYQLKSCNDSDMNPILLGERKLYPQIVVSSNSQSSADPNFILKIAVKTHPNYADLTTKELKCTMSILKRDDTKVYPAELVEFKVRFEFFNLPYDDLLSANAANVLSMIDDAEFLGKWFDSTYKIYKVLDSLCGLVNGADGILSAVSNAWAPISYFMENTPAKPIAYGGNAAIFGSLGIVSDTLNDQFSFVNTACDYVTCRNGGVLGDFWQGALPEGSNDFFKDLNTMWGATDFSNFCSDDITKGVGSTPDDKNAAHIPPKSTPQN